MITRVGDWMQVAGGARFWPCDPRAEEIDIEDIAHALANQCRFLGHCRSFYSVAQHSVHVSEIAHPDDALWGLLHDASEAYLVDIPRPIKPRLVQMGYGALEDAMMAAVCKRFRLDSMQPASVTEADNLMLATEARDLMGDPKDWCPLPPPMPWKVQPWGPEKARRKFLSRYYELIHK